LFHVLQGLFSHAYIMLTLHAPYFFFVSARFLFLHLKLQFLFIFLSCFFHIYTLCSLPLFHIFLSDDLGRHPSLKGRGSYFPLCTALANTAV
jgi:hypothetical protein